MNPAVSDHHQHVLGHAPLLIVPSQAPVDMNHKQQRVASHPNCSHKAFAGELLETPVSAALCAQKEVHCASSACCCLRPSPPPLHYSGFYSWPFFAADSKTHPIFSHLQQQQQHTSMAMKMVPASTDMVMIKT